MEHRIDIKASDLINVIEKLMNRSGVKIKTDFDINLSAPDLSGGLDFSEHDAKIKKEMEHEVQRLMEENARLEKENSDIQNCHMKLYNESKDEMRRMKEENEELKAEIQRLKESQGESNGCCGNCTCEDDLTFMNESDEIGNLLSELQDQHQQDCITINQLHVTIDKLVDRYANLRKNMGVD